MPRRAKERRPNPRVISKELLAREISRIIQDRELTQTEVSYIVRDAPSQISQGTTGHLRGFSPERLIRFLTLLGRDVEIRISRAKRRAGKVRVTVRR